MAADELDVDVDVDVVVVAHNMLTESDLPIMGMKSH